MRRPLRSQGTRERVGSFFWSIEGKKNRKTNSNFLSRECLDLDCRPGRCCGGCCGHQALLWRLLRSPGGVSSSSWPRSRSLLCFWALPGAGPRRIGLGGDWALSASSLRVLRLRPLPLRKKLQRPPRKNPAFASAGPTFPGPEPTTSSMTRTARRRRRSPCARRSQAGGEEEEEEGAAQLLLMLLPPLSTRARPRRRARRPCTSLRSRSCS